MGTITSIPKKFLPSNNLEMKEVIRLFLTTWTIMNSNTNHTSYLSREPREYPCKFFSASVNFYRFNEKIGNLLCILP